MTSAQTLGRQSMAVHTLSRLVHAFRRLRWAIAVLVLGVGALASFFANSQAFLTYKTVALSSEPLYAAASGDKPTIALSLSVEYPTVGAQYVRDDGGGANAEDPTYSNTKEYLGYYDAESCYSYNNAPTETVSTGQTAADYKRFDRVGAAVSRKCADAFSGNFLNWATSSAIDMLRLSLSGGDRYIDTESLTILQRAVIPNGDPICMWNNSNFPAKRLQKDGSATGQYWGAVPQQMVTAANGSDIWIANTLNRVYFKAGNSQGGSCGDTSTYNLAGQTPWRGTVAGSTNNLPSDATTCASENGICSFSGAQVQELWYGAGRRWAVAPVTSGIGCNNNTFGDPISGTVKQCYIRPYSGREAPPASAQGLNSDGFFYSRVSVCGSDGSGNLLDNRDYGFCTRYASGKFKPTGVIQKYSDQVRLAAFGYLMDQTASYNSGGRYGGVLRAPMKYVGQRTFDVFGQDNTPTTGNPNAEWSSTTGIFASNPDGDTSQTPRISGVINYLNKFGRTGPTLGRYKIYDPIGELYYETLRYLQGLQPSGAAVSGVDLTTTAGQTYADGFPVYTDWSSIDPYKDRSNTGNYSCLKSNIVVIGDIHTHDGNRFPNADAPNNVFSVTDWRTVVQNFERNLTSASYVDGQGVTRFSENPNGANGNVPSGSSTSAIMGAAYWAHTHDIRGASWTNQTAKQRPGLRVKTFTFDVNEYGESTSATNRQFSNQLFMAAKYGGFEADSANSGGKPYNVYGNPYRKQQDGTLNNNIWQNPARPGEAASYYLQSNARGVLSAFDDIFSKAASSARSIAGAASQGKRLTSTGNVIFQGAFDTSDWSGDLLAIPVSVDTSNQVTVGSTNYWSASDKLSALGGTAAATRNIVISNRGANPSAQAVNFTWAAVESSLKSDLAKATPASSADSLAESRLNFIRGDRTLDGTTFRLRNKLMGDVINSNAVYSGAPTTSIDSSSYASFYTTNKDRTPAVFVGANDGMLHAFNATINQTDSGKELFAYIPSWMGPKLSALTNKTYTSSHQSYVDGSSAVAEAQVGSAGTAADWKTVLVGSTGAGGRGVFALDVTDPAAFSASKVMWEFSGLHDPDMGYVVGKPQILKFRTNALTATAVYKYFAVVASGVNNSLNDGTDLTNATGRPALFLLDLSKPVGTAWASGTNYFKISLPASALSATVAPGLLNFSPVLTRFGDVSAIFMGDLQGNLWKLNFAKPGYAGTSDWTMSKLSYLQSVASVNTPVPLFIAKDASNPALPQPITVAPRLFTGETADSTYVAFGTGKYLESSDRSSTATQSVYAVLDDPYNNTADASGVSIVGGRGRLQAGAANTATQTVTVPAFRWGRPSSDADTTSRAGFYFDFPGSGERQVSDATVVGNTFLFGSLIPGAAGSSNTCGADGGSGNIWSINIDNGSAVYRSSIVGLLGPPIAFTLGDGATLTDKDNTGRQTRKIPVGPGLVGSKGPTPGVTSYVEIPVGRLSWRQINNYQTLR